MDDMQNKAEAVLFITGSFVSIEDMAKYCGTGSIGIMHEAIEKLKESYKARGSSLEIIEEKGKYKLALKKDYVHLSSKLLTSAELDRPTQETLAIIAYKQPILQSDIIKIRGNGAYEHIHALRDQEFITSEKRGRTRLLKLAPKFYDYFDIVDDQLKSKCDEVSIRVGNVQKFEKEEPAEEKEPEPSEPDPKPIQPDPEPIDPEEPDVKDPRKKEQDSPEQEVK